MFNETLLRNVLKVIKDRPEQTKEIIDSFSDNQYKTKNKLIRCVNEFIDESFNVAILGCWYGSILVPALAPRVNKVIAIDLDDNVIRVGKNRFFNDYNNVSWATGDVFTYDPGFSNIHLVINTSCEHMLPMKEWKWFGAGALSNDQDTSIFRTPKLPDECYFAFQSNNMFGIEGHVNCVNSLQEFKDQMPERAEILFEEEVADTRGTRYMLVGKLTAI